jgi:hypothetical protein
MDRPASFSLSSVAAFFRQHTHDVRNHLNALDLQAALLTELVTEPEAAENVSRIRGQIRTLASNLRTLSAKFADPQGHRSPIAARELFLIWQDQASCVGLDGVAWTNSLGEESVNVDTLGVADVFKELLENAKQFGGGTGLVGIASVEGDKVAFELREPKSEPVDPASWGSFPFASTKRGGYGLGLWQADRVVSASGGTVCRQFLPDGKLVTKLAFPKEEPLLQAATT